MFSINVYDGRTNTVVLTLDIVAKSKGDAIRIAKRKLGGSRKMLALDFYIPKE